MRPLTAEEERFLGFLVKKSAIEVAPDWKKLMSVKPMDEAGMGSLVLFPRGIEDESRAFGRTVFEYNFKDADRVDVIASLNVDQRDELFELDVWKMTFDPLIRFPNTLEDEQ